MAEGVAFCAAPNISTEWDMIFDDRYEVFLADTPESKTLHYQLRYQVYCEETGWERRRQFLQEKLERDGFDENSHHFLVRDRVSLDWVGGMRLVERPFEGLPISKFCQVDRENQGCFEQGRCVEVSRLFVLPDFRCGRRLKSGEAKEPVAGRGSYHYEVILGLIRAARGFGLNNGINSWYFLVEPALARAIKGMGIDLHRCGPGVQHKGLRHPYYVGVNCFERVFSGVDEIRSMFLMEDTYKHYSRIDAVKYLDAEVKPSSICFGNEEASA